MQQAWYESASRSAAQAHALRSTDPGKAGDMKAEAWPMRQAGGPDVAGFNTGMTHSAEGCTCTMQCAAYSSMYGCGERFCCKLRNE